MNSVAHLVEKVATIVTRKMLLRQHLGIKFVARLTTLTFNCSNNVNVNINYKKYKCDVNKKFRGLYLPYLEIQA